jgi:hypothetical protein
MISVAANWLKFCATSRYEEGGSVSNGFGLVRLRTVGHLHPVTVMNWQ